MPDYAACEQDKCKKKNKCARFLMEFGKYQAVTQFPVRNCDSFWDIEKEEVPFKLDHGKLSMAREEDDSKR